MCSKRNVVRKILVLNLLFTLLSEQPLSHVVLGTQHIAFFWFVQHMKSPLFDFWLEYFFFYLLEVGGNVVEFSFRLGGARAIELNTVRHNLVEF